MPEDIKKMLEAGAGLDTDLRIMDDERAVCCVGLLATLYFHDGGKKEVRERVADAVARYRKAIGDRLVWGRDPFTGTPKKVVGTDILNPRAWLDRLGPTDYMEMLAHGGRTKDDADPYRMSVLAREMQPGELSYFSVGLPFAWIAANPPGAFPQLVKELCDVIAPTHGYAGLAVLARAGISRQSPDWPAILALVARFSGLEIDLPWSHGIYLAKEDRIKGVNWLTVLDKSWIDRLGGAEALKGALGPGIDWLPFKTGAIIQAGPAPLFGDTHHQQPMVPYKQVAKALKPIRITSVKSIAPWHGFDEPRSDAWLARFDD